MIKGTLITGRGGDGLHLIAEPLHFVHNVQAAVHDERVHPPCFGAEPSDTISALLRSAEFKLKQWIIFRTHDAKIVGHDGSFMMIDEMTSSNNVFRGDRLILFQF